jgi:hypothetical protein
MWFGYIAPAYRSGEGGGILLVHLKTIGLRGAWRRGKGSQHLVGSVCTADGSWVGGGGGKGDRGGAT